MGDYLKNKELGILYKATSFHLKNEKKYYDHYLILVNVNCKFVISFFSQLAPIIWCFEINPTQTPKKRYDNEVCKVTCFDGLFLVKETFISSRGYRVIDSKQSEA